MTKEAVRMKHALRWGSVRYLAIETARYVGALDA